MNTVAVVPAALTFSILYRIELGETCAYLCDWASRHYPFSILYRIELGETRECFEALRDVRKTFSILYRIELGETNSPSAP